MNKFFKIFLPALGILCAYLAFMIIFAPERLELGLEDNGIDSFAFAYACLWIPGMFAGLGLKALRGAWQNIVSMCLILLCAIGLLGFFGLDLIPNITGYELRTIVAIGLIFHAALLVLLAPRAVNKNELAVA